MIRATSILPAGSWTGTPADTVLLDFEARHRRRLAVSGKAGVAFLLDLPQAVGLRHGDGLLLEDGRIIAVEAAAEPLADVTASSPAHLVRIAWHLGNRQVPTQVMGDHLRIRHDPVVEAMLAELRATVTSVDAPFDPERGLDEDDFPGASFWQGQGFAPDFAFPGGEGFAEARRLVHGNGHAFAESHGHSFASSDGRHRHSTSESHARSPGHEQHDHAESHEPDPDAPQPREG